MPAPERHVRRTPAQAAADPIIRANVSLPVSYKRRWEAISIRTGIPLSVLLRQWIDKAERERGGVEG